MSQPYISKKSPRKLSESIKKKFINEKGFLEVDINSKIPPVQDFLIKLYFYDYIEFIYNFGRGKVFYFQLVAYMNKVFGYSELTVRETVRELCNYKLMSKKTFWNSTLLCLTYASLKFFNQFSDSTMYRLNYDMSSLLQGTFLAENVIMFEPHKRNFYIDLVRSLSFLQEGALSYLRNSCYIVPQKVSKNSAGELLITFAVMDLHSKKRAESIIRAIDLINSQFKPDSEKVFFKINMCFYDLAQCIYVQKSWEKKKDSLIINASRFRDVEFTNLNVARFFEYHSPKRLKGDVNND